MLQPVFEYKLVAFKGDEKFVYEGEDTFKKFGSLDKVGLTKLGWDIGDGKGIYTDLTNGSFDLNGFLLNVDLGLLGKDSENNVRAIPIVELTLEPIWFRRVRQDFAPDGIKVTVKYCVGWKTRYEGKVYQKIVLLDSDDGEITISDRK